MMVIIEVGLHIKIHKHDIQIYFNVLTLISLNIIKSLGAYFGLQSRIVGCPSHVPV